MARFRAGVPVNLRFEGISFRGTAGTEFEIPDEMASDFGSYADRHIRGFEWVIADEIGDLDSRVDALEAGGGGDHPSLAVHDTMGLATQTELDAHEASVDPHTQYTLSTELTAHEGAADPHAGYERESQKGVAGGYASLDGAGTVPDAQIPATIARDSELPDLAGHVAAADPHTGYVREADASWTELTGAGETALHSHAAGAHPDLATHDSLGLATQTELDNHINDAAAAHAASAISIADAGGDFTATDVEGALDELQADHEADATALSDHIADAAGAHAASAISILDSAADFTATDVEGALAELQADNEAHVAAGDPHAGYRLESADHTHASSGAQAGQVSHANLSGVSANQHHNQAHAVDGADHTLAGSATGRFMRATGASAFAFEAVPFSRGGTIYKSDGIADAALNVIVWRAPFACTVTAIKGYRVGGSGATLNARRNGSSNHLASAVSIGSADTWTDGGAVQNAAYAAGDKLEIMIVSASGSPTQLAVQVDFTRP